MATWPLFGGRLRRDPPTASSIVSDQLTAMPPTFTIVIPTYQRSEMLRQVLPSYLATDPLEIVVVDDGSGEHHREVLGAATNADGVRLIALPGHMGTPAARNEGARQASGEWVVFGEDDVWFTPEYPSTLIQHAERADALLAAGRTRLVDPALLDAVPEDLERAIRSRWGVDDLQEPVLGTKWAAQALPSGDTVTPHMTARAAVHRSVFDRVQYDRRYRGNAFREETDFFFSCFEAGIRTIHCPHTACGHMKANARSVPGGAWSMSRPRYVAQMLSNNWSFIEKHEAILREGRARAGRRGGKLRMQLEFTLLMLSRIRPRSASPAPSEEAGGNST
jgi:glycosyltransferase involved in cell wall biosynthesis